MSVIVNDMPKSCFKCEIYCEQLNESVDGLPETILKGRIFIPGNIEKYRIPHEIASYVELKLRENMLTEEESKQAKQEERTAYNKGLADAWEAARKCLNNNALWSFCDLDPGESMFSKYSAARAIEKIKAYEEERDKIKVGDGVFMNFGPNETGIVTHIYSEGRIHIMWTDGTSGEYDITSHKKTGRHFPQVEKLLKMMKEK